MKLYQIIYDLIKWNRPIFRIKVYQMRSRGISWDKVMYAIFRISHDMMWDMRLYMIICTNIRTFFIGFSEYYLFDAKNPHNYPGVVPRVLKCMTVHIGFFSSIFFLNIPNPYLYSLRGLPKILYGSPLKEWR